MSFREWADEIEPTGDKVLSGCCIIILAFLFAVAVFFYAIHDYYAGDEPSEVHPETPGVQDSAR